MEVNGTVNLTVSSGKGVEEVVNGIATVPYVIWETKDGAIQKLEQAGLGDVTVEEVYDNNVTVGHVTAQSIDAGTEVPEGSSITIKVSKGAAPFEMPNVEGKQLSEAQATLEGNGLVVAIEYSNSDEVAENSVISQSIKVGTEVKRGDRVILVISSGKDTISVSDVVGKPFEEAENILKAQGLKVAKLENYDNTVASGIVISQTPEAGSSQIEDVVVVLMVSKGKQPISVTFDGNGGNASSSSSTVYIGSEYGALPTATKTGYTFDGWYSSAVGGVGVTESTTVITPSAHTLYAHWTANTYMVSFDANGGSISAGSSSVIYNSEYGELPSATRTGYAFVGWYTEKDGGTRVTSYTKCTVASNHTVYARWSTTAYQVIFDANGGRVSSDKLLVIIDEAYGALPVATRDGYTFDGWYTSANGGAEITESSVVSSASEHTLYAHWTADSYTVTLSGNGGTSSSLTVTYGNKYGSLPVSVRDGYTFDGWYTEPSGGTAVTADTVVSNSSSHNLYAHWSAKKYTVTFDGNGGTSSSLTIAYGSTYGTLPTSTRDGYTFVGWYTSVSGGAKVLSTTVMDNASNHTLYARWSNDAYTVTLDSNGGDTSYEVVVSYGSAYGTLPTPTKAGHTFVGWYTDKTGGAEVLGSTAVNKTSNHTLYAHWKVNQYTITLNGNGGESSSVTVYYGSNYGVLPTPTRSGYIFDGWYTGKTDGVRITESTIVSESPSYTLYAHWSANKYTITLNGNGGESSTMTVTYGSAYGTLPFPMRTGYTFEGWYTSESGGNAVVESTTVTNDSSHALYAHWTANRYSVLLEYGEDIPYEIDVTYGGTYGSMPTVKKSGYTFDGWYTAENGGTQVTSSTSVTTASNHTLYAHWSANEYTVTLNGNGGTSSSVSVTYGSTYGTLPTPTRAGYTFVGWFTASSGGTKVTLSTAVSSASSHTLYAHWDIVAYTVSWSESSGCSISVERKSSPNGNASIGNISTGATVYYGDVLSITYSADTGYTLNGTGSSSITVTENVTSSSIYAAASLNSYTYNIVYKSVNGTQLGTATATYKYGTTNLIIPEAFTGYHFPDCKNVSWNSTEAKTITFYYTAVSVDTVQTLQTGKWWYRSDAPSKGMDYTVKAEYKNRTANSVQVRVIWTNTLLAMQYFEYRQDFKGSAGGVSFGTVNIAPAERWEAWSDSSKTAYSSWVTVPLSTTDSTSVSLSGSWYDGTGNSGTWSGKLQIPAY